MSIVKLYAEIESNNPEELRRILSHHADYLIDFDNNADVISSISGVETYEENYNEDDILKVLSKIIHDITDKGVPSHEENGYNNRKTFMYEDLTHIASALEVLGY